MPEFGYQAIKLWDCIADTALSQLLKADDLVDQPRGCLICSFLVLRKLEGDTSSACILACIADSTRLVDYIPEFPCALNEVCCIAQRNSDLICDWNKLVRSYQETE